MLGCDCSLGDRLGWGPVRLLRLCSSRTELHCVCFPSVDIPQTVWLLSPKCSHGHRSGQSFTLPSSCHGLSFLFYLTYVTVSLFDGVCRRHDQRLTACNQHKQHKCHLLSSERSYLLQYNKEKFNMTNTVFVMDIYKVHIFGTLRLLWGFPNKHYLSNQELKC